MNTYEVRTQDEFPLGGIASDQEVKVVDDLASGTVTMTSEGGMSLSMGVDPLLERPLVLTISDGEGREVHRAEVEQVGEPEPSTVVMPEAEEDADRSPE